MIQIDRRHSDRSAARGFTLIEVLLALVVTSMLATGVAMMMFSVAQGTASNTDTRRINAKRLITTGRVGDMIRAGYRVLSATDHSLVLWYGDKNNDNQVNISEMGYLVWSSDDKQLTYYSGAAGLATGDDTGYATTSDFATVAGSLVNDTRFPARVWASQVTACTFTTDNADLTKARVITVSMTMTDADQALSGMVQAVFSLRGE